MQPNFCNAKLLKIITDLVIYQIKGNVNLYSKHIMIAENYVEEGMLLPCHQSSTLGNAI